MLGCRRLWPNHFVFVSGSLTDDGSRIVHPITHSPLNGFLEHIFISVLIKRGLYIIFGFLGYSLPVTNARDDDRRQQHRRLIYSTLNGSGSTWPIPQVIFFLSKDTVLKMVSVLLANLHEQSSLECYASITTRGHLQSIYHCSRWPTLVHLRDYPVRYHIHINTLPSPSVISLLSFLHPHFITTVEDAEYPSISPPRFKREALQIRQSLTKITNINEPATPLASEGEGKYKASTAQATLNAASELPSRLCRLIIRLPHRRPPGPFQHIQGFGKGVYSSVMAVRDSRSVDGAQGRVLCVKVFDKKRLAEAEAEWIVVQELQAFQVLAKAARDKWLPFVMRADACMEDNERIFFAMALMKCSLSAVMLDWKEEDILESKKRWIAEIATGIAAIHGAGIIHRDIKPENILIDFGNNVRVSDFGCAYVPDPSGGPLEPATGYTYRRTGTLAYNAPEMFSGTGVQHENWAGYGIEIDYWGLGCIIYELETCCTGHNVKRRDPLFLDEVRFNSYIDPANAELPFEPFDELGDDAFDLITGLLRPDYLHRYGDCEVQGHPYFTDEFLHIKTRGLALSTLLDFKEELPDGVLKPEDPDVPKPTYSPVAYSPRPAPMFDISNIGWINPKGFWGSPCNDRISYTARSV